MTDNNRLPAAYIAESENRQRAAALAVETAARALCGAEGEGPCGQCRHCRKIFAGIHPDITIIKRQTDEKGKQRREIYIAQIRELIADSVILPNEAAFKAYIIDEADTMNPPAQNALLKLLEEPPAYLIIILCATDKNKLLDTVLSRCVTLRTSGEREKFTEETEAFAKELITAALGESALELTRYLAARESLDAAGLGEILKSASELLVKSLAAPGALDGFSRKSRMRFYETCRQCEDYLAQNVGAKHILGLIAARQAALGA